jgi:hypothetical protein
LIGGATKLQAMDPPEDMAGPSRQYEANSMIHHHIKAASAANLCCLFIGQDRAGSWVVKDAQSLCGGLFVNRAEAIRFAMYECQRRPQSVIMLPNGLELDGPLDKDQGNAPVKRRAA